MREKNIRLTADASSLIDALASIEKFAQVSFEVRDRFLSLGDSCAQTRCIDMGNGSAGAFEVRVILEPSNGLADLLSACLAGDFNGL